MKKLIQLFNEIHLIIEKHEYIRKEKGDNYNLFKVINMTSDETRVHSAMIADLLNPNGQHQMENVFLKLFIERLNGQTDHIVSFTCDNAKVECEKYIGPKTDTDGGRLDIYLTDGINHIVIENKIYATDQENQLLRYHNFLKRCSKNKNNTLLLYLSLDGEVHDIDKTTGGEEITFFTISYADFILNWLTDCRHKVIDKSLIREGIAHYLNLIKILTHQMDKEKNELINLIKSNPKYISCISQYKDAIREVYEHICYYYQMAMGDGYNVTREFDLDEFCRNFKHFPVQTDSALHLLERAGYIEYTEEQDNASRIHFLLRRDELYRIHELEAEQEQLIQWVLRSYGGVFSDYVFIDERRIATLSGLTTDQVYHGLLALGRARILHYIPRKKTPYITFSCKRIEKERIVFPSSVYDERKKNFKERIEAMLYYAEEADFCRSKVLLHYFGEKDAQPCEQCDVCRIWKSHPHADATDEQIIALILETLKDGQKHYLSEMTFPGISREKTAQLLHQMIEEETVRIQNGVLFLPRP